jgi:hypothetical protein
MGNDAEFDNLSSRLKYPIDRRMAKIMEFKITEAEAREMAKFEAEVGCDISVGADWGVNLNKVIELAFDRVDSSRLASSQKLSVECKDFVNPS